VTGHAAAPRSRTARIARAAGVVWAAAAAFAPAPAHASGLSNPHISDAHGQPELANPYAVYYNPGALGGVRGTELVVDGALVVGFTRYDRTGPLSPSSSNTASDPNRAAYEASNTGANSAASAGGIPFLGLATDFGSKTFFGGLAAYAPFGGSVKWDKASRYAGSTLLPGAVDGPQRWQSISVNDASVAGTAAFGVRIVPGLSLGVGLTLYSHSIALDKALDSDGSDDVTAPNGDLKEGRALLQVSGLDAGFSGGVYWEPDPGGSLRLGASYISQPGLGSMRLKGTLEQKIGITPSASTDVDVLEAYPDVVRLGAAYRASADVDLRVHGEFSRWSVFQNVCVVHTGMPCDLNADGSAKTPGAIIANVPSDFRNAFAVHAGVGYWPAKRTEIFFDAGVDSSAVPATSLGTTIFDSFKILGTVGLRHRVSERVFLAGSYTAVYYLPVTVTGETESKAPSDVPNANGSYASHLSFFDLSGTFVF
jgi:long-chain fatty acid transport protein